MSGADDQDDVEAEIVDHTDDEIDVASMMGTATTGDAVEHGDPAVQHGDEDADADQDTIAIGESITEAENIDWQALWEEFGFDTPDAIDSVIQPETRLVGALESSDQGIGGDAETLISDAVDNGTLKKKETPKGALRGYLLEAMLE